MFLFFFLVAGASPILSKEDREASAEAIQQERMEFRESIQKQRQDFRSSMVEKRAAFRERLKTLQDTRKKNLVERLDQKFVKLNKLRTDRFMAHLNKLETIMERILDRINAAKAEGKDVAAAESLYQSALDTIETAKTAVETQAAKEYVVTITTEASLRGAVSTTMQQFQADLKAVWQLVHDAKEAVREVAVAIAQVNQSE